jgi:hypothetical protein
MGKIPTAEEFLPKNENGKYSRNEVEKAMIEFAKLHVEACKKELSELVDKRLEGESEIKAFLIDGSSILFAYPLTNIK